MLELKRGNKMRGSHLLCMPIIDTEAERWLSKYFKSSGESRKDYEAELERDNSFREVN